MDFNGEKALEYVRGMTVEVGSRFAGTEGEKKGAEYLLGLFKSFGYDDAKLQPFPIDLYEVWDEKLVVEGLGEVPCKGMLAATDCPKGVTGELVYVETGDECDLPSDVKGKILIVEREWLAGRVTVILVRLPLGI